MPSFSPFPTLPLDVQRDIMANEAGNQTIPRAIGLPDGRFLVTWTDDRHDGIQARFVGADGAVQGSPFEIGVPANFEATDFQAISVAPDGTIWIAALMLDEGAGLYRTTVTSFDAADAATGDFRPDWGIMDSGTTNHHLFPAVEVLANGSAVLSWVEVPDLDDIGDLTLALTGNQRAQIMIDATTTSTGVFAVNNLQYNISIMSNDIVTFDDGTFMVTWSGAVPNATDLFGVYGQLFSASGTKVGGPIDLSGGGSPTATSGRLTQLSDGNIVVVWQASSAEADGMIDVMARIISPTGQPLTGAFVVHANMEGVQQHPDVVALSGSRFVVTWTDESGTLTDPGIGVVGRMFDFSDGLIDPMLGEVFSVNTVTVGDQQFPSIAAAGDSLLIAWQDTFATGASRTGDDVAFRVFDATSLRQSATLSDAEVQVLDLASMRTPSVDTRFGSPALGLDGTYLSDGRVAMLVQRTIDFQTTLVVEIHGTQIPPRRDVLELALPAGAFDADWLPEIMATPAGGFVLFYRELVQIVGGGSSLYLTQQEFDATGSPDGEPMRLREIGFDPVSLYAEMIEGGYRLYVQLHDGFSGVTVTHAETILFAPANSPAANPYAMSGSHRADLIEGLGGNDLIRGLAGNDTINGMDGDDLILGAFGFDLLRGNAGRDTLEGGRGNDTLSGGIGHDILRGGLGDDLLLMDLGNDTLNGGQGRDWVSLAGAVRAARIDLAVTGPQATGFGRDVILGIENVQGGRGNDVLSGNALANVIRGGEGADRLFGRMGHDRLEGNQGFDVIDGGMGHDTLSGGLGFDTLIGAMGNDWLLMDLGNDRLNGGAGRDWISHAGGAQAVRIDLAITGPQATGLGRDTILNIENIQGGASHDVLSGNALANVIRGGNGADRIAGRAGFDWLEGGAGADTLFGGMGNDTLIGGQGFDRLTGGTGADHFVFRAPSDSSAVAGQADMILDFQRGQDRITLRDIDANTNTAGNGTFGFVGSAALSGAGQIATRQLNRPGRDNDITQILLDVNGDGRPDSIIRLVGLYDLTASDFIL